MASFTLRLSRTITLRPSRLVFSSALSQSRSRYPTHYYCFSSSATIPITPLARKPHLIRSLVSMATAAIPPRSKAVQISKSGGPEVIEVVEVDTPSPSPEEVLVKVEYAGVNYCALYIFDHMFLLY